MRNLIRFLIKHFNFILFLLLEAVCVVFIIKYNNFHRVKFLNSSNSITAGIYGSFSNVVDYFTLKRVNEGLSVENARLRSELVRYKMELNANGTTFLSDSIAATYFYQSAKVINNSINKKYNYITLNKGSRHGLKSDMGVIGDKGVVGIITNVSRNYSTAISLLNGRWELSVKHQPSDQNGSLSWDGEDHRKVQLSEIPYNVSVAMGDTITTSGYSAIFPEGVPVGVVSEVQLDPGSNFYTIAVDLFIDFNRLTYVNVVKNLRVDERRSIEEEELDD
ncbi:rod shape-determining protein MreC [Puteibacter caeruleilacunae]|nr:rod shape-determining protein MreC [Puteibacter caeruleilacunae]